MASELDIEDLYDMYEEKSKKELIRLLINKTVILKELRDGDRRFTCRID